MSAGWLQPVVLRGRHVRLEPLAIEHLQALYDAGRYPELWRWTTTRVNSLEDMRAYIDQALELRDRGTALPFTTLNAGTLEVIGSTRFGNADRDNRRVEIGWTWITPAYQRTAANTEAKYLMLRHAFEVLDCIRVEFKTDALNVVSRRALARIGAREEGTLRRHMIVVDGRIRDSVYFSIIREEWPEVRARLESMLSRPATPQPTVSATEH